MTVGFGTFASLELLPTLDKVGFDIWPWDHFLPWSNLSGTFFPETNPMAWALLPICLERTKNSVVGTSVTCPTLRYHPVIVAQFFGQLGYLYPGRVSLGVGSGEAFNEAPLFSGKWPNYNERFGRLIEAIEIIKKLWDSRDFFDYDGKYYSLKDVKMYIKPEVQIPLILSAFGPKSARVAGMLCDGLVTLCTVPFERVEKEIIPNFSASALQSGKEPKTMQKQLWTFGGVFPDPLKAVDLGRLTWGAMADLANLDQPDPRVIDEKARTVSDKEILKFYPFFANVDDLIGYLDKYVKIGINYFVFHDLSIMATTRMLMEMLGTTPELSIKMWTEKVFPYFKEK